MRTTGYCRLCGKIKDHFCCQSCYELDATKSTKKSAMRREIQELEQLLSEALVWVQQKELYNRIAGKIGELES